MALPELRSRERNCKHCNQVFEHVISSGRAKEHCSPECREAYKISRRTPREEWPTCSSPDCGRRVRAQNATKCNPCYRLEAKRRAGVCSVHKCTEPATRSGDGLCERHYRRVRNTGSFDLTPRVELQTSNGYVMVKKPEHPLAAKSNGWAFQHRVVAYEKYGPGPHPCHWCGLVLPWGDLVVDHLNEVKADNRPDNLVPTCNPCNRIRGGMIPFIKRMLPERVGEFVSTLQHMRQNT